MQQPSGSESVERVAVVEHGRYNFRAAAAVGLIVGVVDVLIGGRFLLKLLGASAQSGFVSFIYGVTAPLVGPFHGIFANSGSGNNVFEPAALVAMAVFALIGWGIVVLIRISTAPKGTRPAVS
ncbi:MAG TPA: YggT family protein [Candidatus Dormibacteraeota bacterium]|jgi:hypothetical protein